MHHWLGFEYPADTVVGAPAAPWCMHCGPRGADSKFVKCLYFIGLRLIGLHHGPRGACTTGPVVHAPRAPWCMHCGPSGACTAGPVVHALQAPWCMPRLPHGACAGVRALHCFLKLNVLVLMSSKCHALTVFFQNCFTLAFGCFARM